MIRLLEWRANRFFSISEEALKDEVNPLNDISDHVPEQEHA
jgi:hypothetical protein